MLFSIAATIARASGTTAASCKLWSGWLAASSAAGAMKRQASIATARRFSCRTWSASQAISGLLTATASGERLGDGVWATGQPIGTIEVPMP